MEKPLKMILSCSQWNMGVLVREPEYRLSKGKLGGISF